jgi:hypothetical protein
MTTTTIASAMSAAALVARGVTGRTPIDDTVLRNATDADAPGAENVTTASSRGTHSVQASFDDWGGRTPAEAAALEMAAAS